MTTGEPPRMDAETFLKLRLEDQLNYYRKRGASSKKFHSWIQLLIIIFSAIVPVIVNLPVVKLSDTVPNVWTLVATVFSLLIAILTGCVSFWKFGERWLDFRMTEELLKKEKFLYLTRSGDYSDESTAFTTLVERVENLISAEHSKFQQLAREARRPQKSSEPSEKARS